MDGSSGVYAPGLTFALWTEDGGLKRRQRMRGSANSSPKMAETHRPRRLTDAGPRKRSAPKARNRPSLFAPRRTLCVGNGEKPYTGPIGFADRRRLALFDLERLDR